MVFRIDDSVVSIEGHFVLFVRLLRKRGMESFMSPRKNRRAFTLVELLVVIGIIAVLMGVLLPALGKARETSRRVACLSNLRQLALGVMMYEQTNKRLPGPQIPAQFDYDTVNASPAVISAYYQARQLSNAPMLMKYVNNSKNVFFCPSSNE